MNHKPRIYLAGPIFGKTYEEATGWRNYVTTKLAPHIICISPLEAESLLGNEHQVLKYSYESDVANTIKSIVARDRYYIAKSDCLFCNFTNATSPSFGSVIEIAWADTLRIPVMVIMEKDNLHKHPFLLELASWVVDDLETGINIVENFLLPYHHKKS